MESQRPQDQSRLICPKCQANNFAGTLQCWQCGANLQGQPSGGASSSAFAHPGSATGMNSASPFLAVNSAALLGLMFPLIGLPVGMIFLMLEEPRRVRLGWITIGWSLAGAAINLIITVIGLVMMMPTLNGYLGHGGGGGGSFSMPNIGGTSGE